MLFRSVVAHRRTYSAKRAAAHLCGFLAIAAVLGSFWYIRNLYHQGQLFPRQAAAIQTTSLVYNLPAYMREYGPAGFIWSVAGQTSFAIATAMVPMLVLLCGLLRRKQTRSGKEIDILSLVTVLVYLAFLGFHPSGARHYSYTPLLPGGQLRYGIAVLSMASAYWVILLSRRPVLLPLLCIGLNLPNSRTVFTLALVLGGLAASRLLSCRKEPADSADQAAPADVFSAERTRDA